MNPVNQPLRVLQVVTNMDRGGLETMLMNYYRVIDRTKVQFDFLTHRAERAAYDDEIEALGGKIYHLPHLVPWSRHYQNALSAFFAEHPEYTVVHVHQDCLSSVILKAAKKHDVPVRIAHSHTTGLNLNIKYPVKRLCMRSIPKYATHLFACSTAAGDWMFGGNQYQLLANAVDTEKFLFISDRAAKARENLGLTQNEFLVGHVGSFWRPKNHSFLVDAFLKVVEREPNARLLLVGDGGRLLEIKEKVASLNLSDKVIFTGVRSDVNELLQAMDVFVLPSLYEGLPMVMVEAQAAGLPCLISDKVPPECILTEGLVESVSLSESPDIWAKKILEKRNIPRTDRRAEIAAHGFDIHSTAAELERFYREALEKHHEG